MHCDVNTEKQSHRWLCHWIWGPGRPQLHLGSVCPDDGKSFRPAFWEEESIEHISGDRCAAGFPGHLGGAYHVNWHHGKTRGVDSPERPTRVSGGASARDPSCRRREKMITQEQPHFLTRREQRSQWERFAQCRAKTGHPTGTLIFHYPWDLRDNSPLTTASHTSHWALSIGSLLISAMLGLCCCAAFPSGCGGHFLLRWLPLLGSTSSRARELLAAVERGSIVVAPRLKTQAQYWWVAGSCSAAGGIFPDHGLESPAGAHALHWATREAPSPCC